MSNGLFGEAAPDVVGICSLTLFALTCHKRIADKVELTAANRIVTDDHATRVLAARSGTRIDASLIHAGLILGAVRTDDALGPTVGRRANVCGRTTTDGMLLIDATLAVRAAWRRLARIHVDNYRRTYTTDDTRGHERISG